MEERSIEGETVAALLAALGNTADEVAATLANKGIHGQRRKWFRCPLANYLATQIPDDDGQDALIQAWRSGTVPEPAVQFIRAFDGHGYPELEEK